MTRLLKKWFAVTALSFLFISHLATADDITDAKSKGSALYGDTMQKYGSKEGIRDNAANPIMRSDTLMTTIDGSKAFNAQMLCPSSNKFLEIMIQPAASGDLSSVYVGQDIDMDNVIDYTYSVPVLVSGVCANGIISCNAGTWKNCSYYKWVADAQYRVALTTTTLKELGGCFCINNNCGNNLVWNNIAVVLKAVGGGVAGSIQAQNPQYAVSDVKVEGANIFYYGQKAGSCTTGSGGTGVTDAQKYYSNWAQMSADTEATKFTQSADPESYYSMIVNSLAMQKVNADRRDCSMSRAVSCLPNSIDLAESVTNGCQTLESDSKCSLEEETVDTVKTFKNFNPTMLSPLQGCKALTCQHQESCTNDTMYDSGSISETGCDQYNAVTRISTKVELPCGSEGVSCDYQNSTCSIGGGEGSFRCTGIIDEGGGWGPCNQGRCSGQMSSPCLPNNQPSYFQCDGYVESGDGGPSDTCGSGHCVAPSPTRQYTTYVPAGNAITGVVHQWLESGRSICVHGFYIGIYSPSGNLVAYQNLLYSGTGNNGCGDFTTPLTYIAPTSGNYTVKTWMYNWAEYGGSNCQGMVKKIKCPFDETIPCTGDINSGAVCVQAVTQNVCRDWWRKDRTYLCEIAPYDFTDIQKRAGKVVTTTKDNTTEVYYEDFRKNEAGEWVHENKSYSIGTRDSYEDCEKACKTKKPKTDTQVFEAGHTAEKRVTNVAYDFFYRNCYGSVCHTGEGEEIVKDCQCITEFGEAAAVMQALRMAGKDIICSSGVSKPLQ